MVVAFLRSASRISDRFIVWVSSKIVYFILCVFFYDSFVRLLYVAQGWPSWYLAIWFMPVGVLSFSLIVMALTILLYTLLPTALAGDQGVRSTVRAQALLGLLLSLVYYANVLERGIRTLVGPY